MPEGVEGEGEPVTKDGDGGGCLLFFMGMFVIIMLIALGFVMIGGSR